MKSIKAAHGSVDVSKLSIPDAEEIIEEALNELAFSSDPGLAPASTFWRLPAIRPSSSCAAKTAAASAATPRPTPGRRKKTRCASTSSGSATKSLRAGVPRVASHAPTMPPSRDLARPGFDDDEDDGQEAVIPADLDARVKELCAALAEAERGGHAFIALKWFRDSFLPRKAFRWNQHPESRQAVLAEAIQRGVVVTSKIANPKTPAYPTTTIRLNRAEAGIPEEAQRFHPVAVHGDSIAEAIEDGRRRNEFVSCYFLESTAFAKLFVRGAGHRRAHPPHGGR